ncbi:MAG: HelD family protein [Coriobacteriales bacterium]
MNSKSGKNNGTSICFPEELEHLEFVEDCLSEALADAEESAQRLDSDYTAFKRYLVENRNETDAHEQLQAEALLQQTDRAAVHTAELRTRMAQLQDSPYFARIDFARNGGVPASYYIGRFGFAHKRQRLVVDWRAPIASVFYDCALGPVAYSSPAGCIEGQLTRKRQFKINGGVMEYAVESSEALRDEALQRELALASTQKMRSIIATIQREQNAVIRNERAETLLIQGVAGSGKTSIALHRVAFLLYRHRGQLSARDVAILSPNKVFASYISNVIPELGEGAVGELEFAELAARAFGGIRIEPQRNALEETDPDWLDRCRFKSTLEFARLVEDCAAQLGKTQPRSRMTPLEVYRSFMRSIGAEDLLLMPSANTVEWEDAAPLIVIRAALERQTGGRGVKHLVVDEMQDYTPVQHLALQRLFPSSRKTILGDFGQALSPCPMHKLEDVRALYPGAELVTLTKSYRSTLEIMSFAQHISGQAELEPVLRHGEAPQVITCRSATEELEKVADLVGAFEASEYATLGIIAKTDCDARRVHEALSGRCQLQLLAPESDAFDSGASVTSIRMAKGLEFDEVIVLDASSERYGEAFDRTLLFVACTRALHKLTLLHTGAPSPWLP